MSKKFFASVRTLDELKKEYRRLAMIHHPDCGGDENTMKAINNEFDAMFPALRIAYNLTADTPNTETAADTRSEFYTANGWKGSNYDSARSLKEIAQMVRKFTKDQFPGYKFSVRTHYASMCQELTVEMLEAPCKVYKEFNELTEEDKSNLLTRMRRNNVFTLESWFDSDLESEFSRIWATDGDWFRCVSDQITATAEAVDSYVQSFNLEDCDGMIDYFHVNFYYFGCLRDNGRHIKYVPATARIKAPENKTPSAGVTRVEFTPEFNGIEVYFSARPAESVRSALKSAGFRWHSVKKCWYNKNTENNLATLRAIESGATA